MLLRLLGRGGSKTGDCPTLYATDRNTYLVIGWETDPGTGTVRLPHLLLGFAEPDTYLGATMTDAEDGTFFITGRPVTEPDVLARVELAAGETCIEVPKHRRTFYGVEDR